MTARTTKGATTRSATDSEPCDNGPPPGTKREPRRSEALLDELRDLVLGGDYLPGAALSELQLAKHFATSRTPVREALKQLQVEGLVEIKPKVGTFVRGASRREIVEMFELKESLEGLAASLMARRGRVPELDVLERNIEASERAAAANDHDRYADLVHEFHQTIVDGSDNRKLQQHYRTLMNQLAYPRLVSRSLRHPGRLPQSAGEHRLVVSRIEEKDVWGAEQAMRDHVRASARESLTER